MRLGKVPTSRKGMRAPGGGSWDKAFGGNCLRQAPLECCVHQVQPLRLWDLGGWVCHRKHPGHSGECLGLPWGSWGTEGREAPEEEAALRKGQEGVPQTLTAHPDPTQSEFLDPISTPLLRTWGPARGCRGRLRRTGSY